VSLTRGSDLGTKAITSLITFFFCSGKILKCLVGMTEIRDALQRLEKLTQEEVQMMAHGVARAAARVSDEVEKVGDQVSSGARGFS